MRDLLKCPSCGTIYDREPGRNFCDHDGSRLVGIQYPTSILDKKQSPKISRVRQNLGRPILYLGLIGLTGVVWTTLALQKLMPSDSANKLDAHKRSEIAQEALNFEGTGPSGPLFECFGKTMPGLPIEQQGDVTQTAVQAESIIESVTINATKALSTQKTDTENAAIGEAIFKTLTKKTKGALDQIKTDRANQIIRKLQRNSKRSGRLSYRARVIEGKTANAFALPGGLIVILKPLMETLADESEIAFVLSHEIAHSELHHIDAMVELPRAAGDLGSAIFGDDVGEIADAVSTSAINASRTLYDQRQEFAADRYGICLTYLAKFNTAKAPDALSKLSTPKEHSMERSRQDGPSIFQIAYDIIESHPPTGVRTSYLKVLNKYISDRE
jgi:hypothetical protein